MFDLNTVLNNNGFGNGGNGDGGVFSGLGDGGDFVDNFSDDSLGGGGYGGGGGGGYLGGGSGGLIGSYVDV